SHVKRADRPRQYILTTHNPMLLNFFEPNEVRIVERDEQGVTTVQPIDLNVAKAWLEEEGAYNLGDIWTTRLLGGVPE
ncbi:MAG: AAA family ATPase, partial [Aggregatilineales bacterium]